MATAYKTHDLPPVAPDPTHPDAVVVRFAGDSGDGMQLTGGQFTLSAALAGNDFATFPDFPAEIRAPQGTTFGVSAFQINFGAIDIETAGDEPDNYYRQCARDSLVGARNEGRPVVWLSNLWLRWKLRPTRPRQTSACLPCEFFTHSRYGPPGHGHSQSASGATHAPHKPSSSASPSPLRSSQPVSLARHSSRNRCNSFTAGCARPSRSGSLLPGI